MTIKLYEIKHRITGAVLFSMECDSLKIAVETAVGTDTNLAGANLADTNLRGANLAGANLRGANLAGINLVGANLVDANLNDAYLRGGNLTCANLVDANLNAANLADAYLRGANLTGVKIRSNITISKKPIQITGSRWNIIIWDEHMQIGCEFHSLADWFDFDDRRILKMDGKTALKFRREWKAPLMAICIANGRVI